MSAKDIVDAIIDDLCDRRGLRQEWNAIDRATRAEIIGAWVKIAERLAPPLSVNEHRVMLERDDAEGLIYIKHHGAIMAHTKSFNVARRIRDALNAPETLVGQVIRLDKPVYGNDAAGRFAETGRQVIVGIVMAVSPTFDALLRLPNNTLETHSLEGAEVLDHPEVMP